jgi:hypothetical protein
MPTGSGSRGWIWFFVILAVLAAAAVGIQIWYNAGQQLTSEKLEAAVAKWSEHGPRDYDIEYTVKKPDITESYKVQVRANKVTSVTRNGEEVEERLYRYSSMPALLGFIDDFLKKDLADAKKGKKRPFAVATFDPQDGHLEHYIRSAGPSDRVEITVEFQKVEKP